MFNRSLKGRFQKKEKKGRKIMIVAMILLIVGATLAQAVAVNKKIEMGK